MTIFIFANNVNTTLAGAISSTSSSLTLSSSANLPSSIPTGAVFVITLNDRATGQNYEIIYATSISGATLSGLQRGQDGTAAQAWLTNDYAYSAPTAGEMNGFGQLGENNSWTGNNSFSNPVVIASAAIGSSTEAVNQGQFGSSIGSSGWKEYPDPNSPTGFTIEQWGTVTGANQTAVTFPKPFPTACLNVQITESNANVSTWGAGLATIHGSSSKSTTGFTHWTLSWTGTQWVSNTNTADWRAWGY